MTTLRVCSAWTFPSLARARPRNTARMEPLLRSRTVAETEHEAVTKLPRDRVLNLTNVAERTQLDGQCALWMSKRETSRSTICSNVDSSVSPDCPGMTETSTRQVSGAAAVLETSMHSAAEMAADGKRSRRPR